MLLSNSPRPSPALVAWCNAVPNVLWSALSFVPLCLYCYRLVAPPWLYTCGAVSLLAYCVPTAWLRHGQLSASPATYRRLGVPLAGRLAQHGAVVNRLLRRWYPGYRYLPTRAALAGLARTTYQQERFHWAGLVFFVGMSVHAVSHAHLAWAGLLGLVNVFYNLYPIWLQQYIRLRLPGLPRRA